MSPGVVSLAAAEADFRNETIGFAANRALADPPAPARRQARCLGAT